MLAAGVLAAPAAASADGGGTISVTVHRASGTAGESVTVDGLKSDPTNCPPFPATALDLHAPTGASSEQSTADGWSLATVLACLPTPIPLARVTAVVIDRDSGTPEAALAHADLESPSDFSDPSAVPLIYSTGTQLSYYRPWRGGNDDNLRDHQFYTDGMSIEVFEGPPIRVSVTPTQQTIDATGTVSFTASVLDPSDPGLSYRWTFDGGAPDVSGSPTTTAQFPNAGDFHVTVEVTDAAGGGGNAVSDITVRGTTPPQQTNTTPQSGKNGAANNPPPKTGNPGNTGNAGSPQPQKTDHRRGGRANQTQSPTAGKHTAPTHTRATPQTQSQSQPTAATPNPPTSSGGPAPPPASTSPSAPARRTPPPRHRLKIPATPSPQQLVTGQLVNDIIPLPATRSPLVRTVPASPGSAPRHRVLTASVVPVLAGILSVLVLLVLGAARELRGRRDWRMLRFGS